MDQKYVRILSLGVTVISLVATVATSYLNEQTMKNEIAEEITRQLAEKTVKES